MTRTFLFGHDQAAKFRWLVGLAIVALAKRVAKDMLPKEWSGKA